MISLDALFSIEIMDGQMDCLFENIYKYVTEDRGRIARDIRKSLGNPMGFWDAKKAEKNL